MWKSQPRSDDWIADVISCVLCFGDAMAWTIVDHVAALAEADAQPREIRARLLWFTQLIAEHGFGGLPPKAAKHLQDDVWELRLTGRELGLAMKRAKEMT